MSQSRNADCACGSGKKYKRCHGVITKGESALSKTLTMFGFLAVGALLLWAGYSMSTKPLAPADGRVWSAEHGHWHDASGRELGAASPDVPPVDGAVWSAEHGHWHDASGQEISAGAAPAAPDGRVWSPEHNHWH